MAAGKGFEPLALIYLGVNLQFHALVLETSVLNRSTNLPFRYVKTHLSERVGAVKDFYSIKEVVIKPTLPSSCVLAAFTTMTLTTAYLLK